MGSTALDVPYNLALTHLVLVLCAASVLQPITTGQPPPADAEGSVSVSTGTSMVPTFFGGSMLHRTSPEGGGDEDSQDFEQSCTTSSPSENGQFDLGFVIKTTLTQQQLLIRNVL